MLVERSWAVLKKELLRMQAADPSPLRSYPNPNPSPASDAGRRPPFHVHLAAWAEQDADRLRMLLGDDIRLIVGAQLFPERLPPRPQAPVTPVAADDRVRVSCAEQLQVRSGHDLHGRVTLTNLSEGRVELRHRDRHPSVTGLVADPATGEIVSGYIGFSPLMGGTFTIEPGTALDVPLTVYTDSVAARLGYAVPAGRWDVRVLIAYPDTTFSYAEPLPLEIA